MLPAAIERDVLIAYTTTSSPSTEIQGSVPKPTKAGRTVVVLRNVESEKYTDTHFEVDLNSWGGDLPLPKTHHWSSYFIAGTKVRDTQQSAAPGPFLTLYCSVTALPRASFNTCTRILPKMAKRVRTSQLTSSCSFGAAFPKDPD